jgi:hypothetical protein
MGRGTCSLVAMAMAVLVSMGAAGAGAEARSPSAGSAALCQRGGYANLDNARTGARFTDESPVWPTASTAIRTRRSW